MPASPTIRAVRRSDFEQWLPLWEGYNAFYGRVGATALPAEITHMTWARFFDAYEPMHARVAESDGRLVGLAQSPSMIARLVIRPSLETRNKSARDSFPAALDIRAKLAQIDLQVAPIVADDIPVHHRRASAGGRRRQAIGRAAAQCVVREGAGDGEENAEDHPEQHRHRNSPGPADCHHENVVGARFVPDATVAVTRMPALP
jgi:hypothetical protein